MEAGTRSFSSAVAKVCRMGSTIWLEIAARRRILMTHHDRERYAYHSLAEANCNKDIANRLELSLR